MKSEYNEKTTLKYSPCKPREQSCVKFDYDPCECSDDITEKDLAFLLSEEEKLLEEIEKETEELEGTLQEQELLKKEDKKDEKKEERKEEIKDLPQSAKPVKKCKKVIKNPFFNNRLEFSSCLPPPPPTPPPQFFPTFEEEELKKCTKKRKKKCKKIKPGYKDVEKPSSLEYELEEKNEEKKEEKKEEMREETGEAEEEEEEEEEEEKEKEEEEKREEEEEKREEEEEKREEEEEKREEEDAESEEEQRDHRRKCRKIYRPPCRKKSSEISNMFQPRQIPARQRDLPETSPFETPEVERQIWLRCKNDCQTDCVKNNCKMACLKRKCRKKRRNSEGTSKD